MSLGVYLLENCGTILGKFHHSIKIMCPWEASGGNKLLHTVIALADTTTSMCNLMRMEPHQKENARPKLPHTFCTSLHGPCTCLRSWSGGLHPGHG
jgi:hypothetical protein